MGRTLFWYVFKDLLKIFLMTSGTLAGVMSFVGLLRPLTQHGLDPAQVGQMLAYFTPAMTAYSLPVAALFAATVVYGRLSADNELTACRAGGISLGPMFGMAFPALLFGLLAALVSLLFLCFLVPKYTLKVERVLYSNIAKLIANQIERKHELDKFGGVNIFAQRAYLPPPDPKNPSRQLVVLEGVSFVQYDKVEKPTTRPAGGPQEAPKRIPREFLMASSATIEIRDRDGEKAELLIGLENGIKYPREFRGGSQLGIETTQFGPIEIPSKIEEDTKFMDVQMLKHLYENPEESNKIGAIIARFVRRDQTRRYIEDLRSKLNNPAQRSIVFRNERYTMVVSLDPSSAPEAFIGGPDDDELIVAGTAAATVTFEKTGQEQSLQTAKELRLKARPDTETGQMVVTVELYGRSPGGASTRPVSGNYSEVVLVPMPPEILALKDRRADAFKRSLDLPRGETRELGRELIVLSNNILAESNGRASFAVSCLILVLVGSALGMLFRSGNFLTAFAVSFVPALVCITMIVAGQQVCHAVPFEFEKEANPLKLGLALIWSGNLLALVIATSLMWRLQRK